MTRRSYFHVIALLVAVLCAAGFVLSGCTPQKDQQVEEVPTLEVDLLNDKERTAPDPEYILVLGDDAWGKYTPGRSDLMMLMRVEFDTPQVTLVTIPRDTAYAYDDGSTVKANQAFLDGGPEAACKAASTITGTQVSNYVVIGFDGLQSIVGHFGGVDLDLPYSLEYTFYTKDYSAEYFTAGQQTLTPWRAMAISRARTGYSDYGLEEDMLRQIVDRQMMTKLIEYAFEDRGQTSDLIVSLLPHVNTNIPVETITTWTAELAAANEITIYATSGPAAGSIDSATQLWLVPAAPEKWQALMEVVNAGEDPATIDVQFSGTVQPDRAPINTKTVIAK